MIHPVPSLASLAPRLLEFPQVHDQRGNLTFIESCEHIPFEIRRVYYLYDIPGGAHRGGHAHRSLEQCLIAVSGSFDVVVDVGSDRQSITLNRSFYGLYLPRMVWREITNFSSGSVCLVLASDFYCEEDYIRDHSEFLQSLGIGR